MIQYQDKLVNKVSHLTLDNCPRSLLLSGMPGCGKHTLAQMISEQLSLTLRNISEGINDEIISDIYLQPNPAIYLLELSKLSEKQQNSILKFVEEPLKNSYIILVADNENQVIPTVKNRCVKWVFENYTSNQLSTFVEDATVLKYLDLCNTPGQVKELNLSKDILFDMIQLSEKLIDKISVANVANTLTISDKVDFDNSGKKYPLDLFLKALKNYAARKLKVDSKNNILAMYQEISDTQYKLSLPNVSKKYIFEAMLLNLWKIGRM